jgi:hypothetical protein
MVDGPDEADEEHYGVRMEEYNRSKRKVSRNEEVKGLRGSWCAFL